MIIYKILIHLSTVIYSGSVLPLIMSTPPEPDNLVISNTNKYSFFADNSLKNNILVSMECVDASPRFYVPELD